MNLLLVVEVPPRIQTPSWGATGIGGGWQAGPPHQLLLNSDDQNPIWVAFTLYTVSFQKYKVFTYPTTSFFGGADAPFAELSSAFFAWAWASSFTASSGSSAWQGVQGSQKAWKLSSISGLLGLSWP